MDEHIIYQFIPAAATILSVIIAASLANRAVRAAQAVSETAQRQRDAIDAAITHKLELIHVEINGQFSRQVGMVIDATMRLAIAMEKNAELELILQRLQNNDKKS